MAVRKCRESNLNRPRPLHPKSFTIQRSSNVLKSRVQKALLFFFFILSGLRLSSLGTAGTIGLLYQPQMMVIVEKFVEWRLARETEVLGENLPQRYFVPTKSHMTRPGLKAHLNSPQKKPRPFREDALQLWDTSNELSLRALTDAGKAPPHGLQYQTVSRHRY
jgi:hypothetical protein